MKKRLLHILLVVTLTMTGCGKGGEPKDVMVAELTTAPAETHAVNDIPAANVSEKQTEKPVATEELKVTEAPEVTDAPTQKPEVTLAPTNAPVEEKVEVTEAPKPTKVPTTAAPTAEPVVTPAPTKEPSKEPDVTPEPTPEPTAAPTDNPAPTQTPTEAPAHDHSWDGGSVTTEATCGSEGVKTFTCACGETKTESIAATGKHNWKTSIVYYGPTCNKDGHESQKCTDCDSLQSVNIPATGEHDYECTEEGCGFEPTKYVCKQCYTWYEQMEKSCVDADGDNICDLYGCWVGN